MRSLVQLLVLIRAAPAVSWGYCSDRNPSCPAWAKAGECDKEKIDPWTGKEHKDERDRPIELICAPFTGGTPTYMSEEVGGLRRCLEVGGATATTL